MKNSRKNFVILLLVLTLSVLIPVTFFVYRESEEIKTEMSFTKKQNDSIQNALLSKNKELIDLLTKVQKEINLLRETGNQEIDGIIHDNKPITLEELIEITNRFETENANLKMKATRDSLKIERLNNILSQLEKDKVISKKEKGSYSYRQITKLDSLYDSSLQELDKTKTDLNARNT